MQFLNKIKYFVDLQNELSHEKILDEKDRLKSGQENKENTNGNCSSLKDTWYWVGKDSLRLWSSLALKKFEARLPSNQVLDQLGIDQLYPNSLETLGLPFF